LQPPKSRFNHAKPAAKPKAKLSKPKIAVPKIAVPKAKRNRGVRESFKVNRSTASARRAQLKESRRFTKESQIKKIFLRSLLGAVLALILLVLATMFTPIMAINKISITGTEKVPEKQLQAALKKYIGTPLPMINGNNVADDLAKFKLIESISLVSKPPYELQVRIVERTPISVVVKDGVGFLYDPSGVRVGVATGREKLPTIIITGDPKSSKNYKQAIDVLLSLPSSLLDRVAYIQARTRDNVTMQLRGNAVQTIIWGDSTQSALKSRVLKVLLFKTPARIPATFDVSSPLTPSVIR
jgi:cell division protein FtsQ